MNTRDMDSAMNNEVLRALKLHPLLLERINHTVRQISSKDDTFPTNGQSSETSYKSSLTSSYILYMPTVTLRSKHNPALALAVRLANYFKIPLIILVVLTSDHNPSPEFGDYRVSKDKYKCPKITSRRLAFLLEGLLPTMKKWKSKYNASVFLRIHNPPSYQLHDHLTLAVRAHAVVVDEPFVQPYLSLVEKTERAVLSCFQSGTTLNSLHRPCGCFRVDGSTTVPPLAVLQQKKKSHDPAFIESQYTGLPSKAWLWQKKTEKYRMGHLIAAQQGHFDPPSPLLVSLQEDNFCSKNGNLLNVTYNLDRKEKDQIHENVKKENYKSQSEDIPLFDYDTFLSKIPPTWKNSSLRAPDMRPWSISEFEQIMCDVGIKKWAVNWSGSDSSVSPCQQTIGTYEYGMKRWNQWRHERNGMNRYAALRNKITSPHAPSRMSCYLNLGIVSIFDLIMEVMVEMKKGEKGNRNKMNKTGAQKFEEEIVKWREFSYAHAFCHGKYYNNVQCVPQWAKTWLQQGYNSKTSAMKMENHSALPTINQLIKAQTGDETWNAMQQYLINTGELHNNARMTWGKTIISWARNGAPFIYEFLDDFENVQSSSDKHASTCSYSVAERVLSILCYLNDRFALDGLAPPSYAGLLWCLGWTDKPGRNGMISEKLASNYRVGSSGFYDAERLVLRDLPSESKSKIVLSALTNSCIQTESNSIMKYLGKKRMIDDVESD